MNVLLSPNPLLFWLSSALALTLLVAAAWQAPWRHLAAIPARQHLLAAATLGLAVLWLLQVRVQGVLAIHPLLITVTTMVFGVSLALWVGFVALIFLKIFQVALGGIAVNGFVGMGSGSLWLQVLPVDFCLGIAVPAAWAWVMLWLVNHWQLKNPFTYFWGVGFFGAMLGCVVMGCTAWLVFFLTHNAVHQLMIEQYFFVFFLMTFPEGFINGILATAFSVLTPHLVRTYRDDWFLR